jgi:hypothetical protein
MERLRSLCRRLRDLIGGELLLAAIKLDALYEDQFFDRMVKYGADAVPFTRTDRMLSRWAGRLERWGSHLLGEQTTGERLGHWLKSDESLIQSYEPLDPMDMTDEELIKAVREIEVSPEEIARWEDDGGLSYAYRMREQGLA